jgi:uncharacterized membrane protein YfcA
VIASPTFYLAAAAAVTVLGLAKGGFVGIGLVATPLLALVVPPVQAAAILLPIMLLQDVFSLFAYRRHWDARNLKIMLPGAVVGVGAAGLLAASLPEPLVRLAVGVIALAFVLKAAAGALLNHPRPTAPPGVASGVFWGALSGFTSTLSHAGSPPFQVYVMPQRLERLTFAGTATIFFAAVNLMKVVPYLALGQFSSENLATSAALIPLALATNYLGFVLVRRMPTTLFYRIAYWLVFLISLELIRSGTMALIGR